MLTSLDKVGKYDSNILSYYETLFTYCCNKGTHLTAFSQGKKIGFLLRIKTVLTSLEFTFVLSILRQMHVNALLNYQKMMFIHATKVRRMLENSYSSFEELPHLHHIKINNIEHLPW